MSPCHRRGIVCDLLSRSSPPPSGPFVPAPGGAAVCPVQCLRGFLSLLGFPWADRPASHCTPSPDAQVHVPPSVQPHPTFLTPSSFTATWGAGVELHRRWSWVLWFLIFLVLVFFGGGEGRGKVFILPYENFEIKFKLLSASGNMFSSFGEMSLVADGSYTVFVILTSSSLLSSTPVLPLPSPPHLLK